jgi:prepilin signal peptidase PulO-like enzyme (type II secretory pathway)
MAGISVLISGDFTFLWIVLIAFLLPFLFVYGKAVEECCMIKEIEVKELTEGDWLYRDIRVGKKIVKADWEGLSTDDLKILKKYKKGKVLIKQGIPFVPVFLVSFAVLLVLV